MMLPEANAESTAPDQHHQARPAATGSADMPGPADVGVERGRTTIGEQAVQRLAARLIVESEYTGGAAHRGLGLTRGAGSHGYEPEVRARMHGETAISLRVRCSIAYPRPVRQTTDAVRTLLTHRIEELTGLAVHNVDITVIELSTEAGVRVQ